MVKRTNDNRDIASVVEGNRHIDYLRSLHFNNRLRSIDERRNRTTKHGVSGETSKSSMNVPIDTVLELELLHS